MTLKNYLPHLVLIDDIVAQTYAVVQAEVYGQIRLV